MTSLRLSLLVALSLGLSAVALATLPAPYIWVSLVWFIACLLAMRSAARSSLRALWLNLAVIFVTLGAFEVWAGARPGGQARNRDPRQAQVTYIPENYIQPDDILGRAPTPGTVTRSLKRYGEVLLYDVKYTFGPDGLRISPPSRGGPPEACVLFFGDSFTFGEGVDDTQTMPYRVGEIGGGRFRVYNFGFHGYGPHQMLSALEHGRVASIVKCRPTHVIYLAIEDHVLRVVGRKAWTGHDPRYRLQPDGSVRYDGTFDDQKQLVAGSRRGTHGQLEKSALYRWVMARDEGASEQALQLFVSIVAQARRMVEVSYPGSVFETLFWDKRGRTSDVESALQRAGFAPRNVADILVSYHENYAQYHIPHDGHPSANGYDRVARYIVASIIGEPSSP